MVKVCAHCGAEFEVRPSHFDAVVYCSKSCMAAAYSNRMRGAGNPNYRGAGEKKCPQCGKEFHDYGKKVYCSVECYSRSEKKSVDARRANDGVRKPGLLCKKCGAPTLSRRVYCSDCNPNRGREYRCLNCGKLTGKKYDVSFCAECREKGLHKKIVSSICERCGAEVPGVQGRKYCDACWKATVRIRRGVPRKKDANQNEIVAALERIGCSVIDASAIGGGFPDLIIGKDHVNYLFEVKNPKARGNLNQRQEEFFDAWRGQVAIVRTIREAFDALGIVVDGIKIAE